MAATAIVLRTLADLASLFGRPMILDLASALMLTLGVYSSWLARPSAERGETLSDIGEYLGGLLIISGLLLLGWQLGRAVNFSASVRF